METAEREALVSVIMPAYNVEKYISEAIESVLAQTYLNWELIVIDDCSQDRTVAVVRKYTESDDRIQLYQNEENMGVTRTRNRGFEIAKGDYVSLLDSDDKWFRNKLEKQMELAKRSGSQIVYCSYAMIDGATGEKRREYLVSPQISYRSMLAENEIGCSTVVLSKEIVKNHRFSAEFSHEDYALWLQLLREGYLATGCTEVLAAYRVLSNSRSNDKIKSAKNRWLIYREQEKLHLITTFYFFVQYAFRGWRKYGRSVV